MKNIFLTSGVVLSLVSSAAFADTATFGGATENTQANADNTWCDHDNLNVYSGPTRLAAIWSADTFDVSYVGGTPGAGTDGAATGTIANLPETAEATFDAPFSVSSVVPTLTGWTFVNWTADYNMATAANEDTDYASSAPISQFKVAHDVQLTANWTPNQYTVRYSCTGLEPNTVDEGVTASGTIGDYTATYDSPFAANDGTTCSLAGHTFAGWSCTDGAQETPQSVTLPGNGNKWNLTTGATCTATWTQNTIQPQWLGNGADSGWTAGNATTNCTYNSTVTLPTAPTKNGYVFGGWKVIPSAAECEDPNSAVYGTPDCQIQE